MNKYTRAQIDPSIRLFKKSVSDVIAQEMKDFRRATGTAVSRIDIDLIDVSVNDPDEAVEFILGDVDVEIMDAPDSP